MLYERSAVRYLKLVAWEAYATYEEWLDWHQKRNDMINYKGAHKYSQCTPGKYFASVEAFASAWVGGVYESLGDEVVKYPVLR